MLAEMEQLLLVEGSGSDDADDGSAR
jgi:hypothetical protein